MTGPPVLFASTVDVDAHDTGPGHPERPERLVAVATGLRRAGLADALEPLQAPAASREDLARVHDTGYLDALERLCAAGGGDLDPDTPTGPGSWGTAERAAGLGLAAIGALRAGAARAAFVAPRPPGHHATRWRGMGFCLVNNVAVAAGALEAAGERVAILDWDVHHGNGTQAIFWDDPDVLYVSLHESPAYPGTGAASETGGSDAPGLTLNVPLPAGSTGDAARLALDELIGPAIEAFAPDWLLVSAGFDAHRDDPLAGLEWSAGDYAELTRHVLPLAPAGRTILFLEGGYDLGALGRCVAATVGALAGVDAAAEPPTSGGAGRDAVLAARSTRSRILGGRT